MFLKSLNLVNLVSLPIASTTDCVVGFTPKVSPSITLVIPPGNLLILDLKLFIALVLAVVSLPAFLNCLSIVFSKSLSF